MEALTAQELRWVVGSDSQLSYGDFGGQSSLPVSIFPYSAIGMGAALSGAIRFLDLAR